LAAYANTLRTRALDEPQVSAMQTRGKGVIAMELSQLTTAE
jgi:hypothetical protein